MENYEIISKSAFKQEKKCSIKDEREDNESAFF